MRKTKLIKKLHTNTTNDHKFINQLPPSLAQNKNNKVPKIEINVPGEGRHTNLVTVYKLALV